MGARGAAAAAAAGAGAGNGEAAANGDGDAPPPSELLFKHAGHRAPVVDFNWNAADPWTFASVSDDGNMSDLGGGTLQVWRVSDLVHRSGFEWEARVTSALASMRQGLVMGPPTPGVF